MQGTILSVTPPNGQGLILGDDGVRYTYTPMGWRDHNVGAYPGMKVDFEIRGAHAVGVYPLPGQIPPPPPPAPVVGSGYPNQLPIRGPSPIPTPIMPGGYQNQPPGPTPAVPASPVFSSTPGQPPPGQFPATTSNAPASSSTSKVLIWGLLAIAVVGISMMALFMLTGGTDGVGDFSGGEDVKPTPLPKRTYSDTRDRVRGFDEDEDERSTYSDTVDRVRDFAEDEDVQRTFNDASDAVERGLDSIFGD